MEKIISNEHIMSKEAFNELIDGIEIVGSLTDYGRANIKYHVKLLQQENKQLKERLERLDNYLDKNYTMENQYWFDHIRDIVEDR